MAEAGTLHDAFIDELRDTYDAEKQLTKALPKLAKASSNPKLRQAFESHLEETQGQVERLEQVFESLGEKVRGKHCDGIAGIIEEGKSIMEEDFDETTMDARPSSSPRAANRTLPGSEDVTVSGRPTAVEASPRNAYPRAARSLPAVTPSARIDCTTSAP